MDLHSLTVNIHSSTLDYDEEVLKVSVTTSTIVVLELNITISLGVFIMFF